MKSRTEDPFASEIFIFSREFGESSEAAHQQPLKVWVRVGSLRAKKKAKASPFVPS